MGMDLAKIPWVKTVCEIGFNAGHSAVSWLAANPDIFLYSFDLGYHKYTRPIAQYLKQRYPGRFEIILGDSTKTLPKFIASHPTVKCDVMSIDGGHFYDIALHDFNNFRKMASARNLLHYDDYPSCSHPVQAQEIGKVWEDKRENGEMTEVLKCCFKKDVKNKIGMKGFSVGHIHI